MVATTKIGAGRRPVSQDVDPTVTARGIEARTTPGTTPRSPFVPFDVEGLAAKRGTTLARLTAYRWAQANADDLPEVPSCAMNNHGHNVSWSPKIAFRPGPDIDELAAVIRYIRETMPDAKIKAGGSRHSWSPTAASDAVYIHPESMKRIEFQDDGLLRVSAGTTIRETNRFLWKRGKALPVLGGFDGQTWGGVLPTGTHGSVPTRGPMADLIRSIDLVRADGSKVRIEPDDGPTDAGEFESTHADHELLQNDDVFDAAIVNMGTMGVVHSYAVEVTDAFHLREVRTKVPLSEVRRTLKTTGEFDGHPADPYHLEVLFNPHGDADGHAIVTSRHPTEVDEDDEQRLGFKPPGRDLFRSLDLGAQFTRPAIPTWITEHLGDAARWTTDAIARVFPGATPWLVDRALDSLVDDEYVDRSFNVFNIGDGANQIPALAGTMFVPVANDAHLEAIDVLTSTAKKFAERGRYHSGPISMRFVGKSRAMLCADRDVASFELIFTGGNEHAQEMIEAYDQALRRHFGDDVTVHWGQMMKTPTRKQLERMYPRFDQFCAIRDTFDPDGVFLNEWQSTFLQSRAERSTREQLNRR